MDPYKQQPEASKPQLPPPYAFEQGIQSPPIIPNAPEEPAPQRAAMPNLPQFLEEEVREAVARFATETCCYGEAFPREMQVTEITMKSAFHYTFESFAEKRESCWRFVPYTGQRIDGPANGPSPAPWEMTVTPRKYFLNSQVKNVVPHTDYVKPCHVCVGNGRVRCERCRGRGRVDNSNSAIPDRCYMCSGKGQQTCVTCDGKGNVKGFVELTVTWHNYLDEYISETVTVPKMLVREASGQIAFLEEMPKVRPVTNGTNPHINEVSKTIAAKHDRSFPNQRILRQRHRLLVIPVAECIYTWKDKGGSFSVYGLEHKVHFPDYPQSCCCGCNIL